MKQNDFISQKYLEDLADPDNPLTMSEDLLGHGGIVTSIFMAANALPIGSVIAIHAPWGRGKSDVLLRTALLTYQANQKGLKTAFANALWINPWQYQTPDLLTPLVAALLGRIKKNKFIKEPKEVKETAKQILRSGLKFGLGVAKNLAPIPYLIEAAEAPLDELFDELWGEDEQSSSVDAVYALGQSFKELVELALKEEGEIKPQKLLICIDDLDRCLPDRQIALLQAIKFLLASGAPATFIIALDPRLTANALQAHYEIDAVDANGYLDKMFDLRLYLHPPNKQRTLTLIENLLKRETTLRGKKHQIADLVGNVFYLGGEDAPGLTLGDLSQSLLTTMKLANCDNPRFIRRMIDKLMVFAIAATYGKQTLATTDQTYSIQTRAIWLCMWLVICERWPEVRTALQHSEYKLITKILNLYNTHAKSFSEIESAGQENVLDIWSSQITKAGLPAPEQDADFYRFIEDASTNQSIINSGFQNTIRAVDILLLKFGM